MSNRVLLRALAQEVINAINADGVGRMLADIYDPTGAEIDLVGGRAPFVSKSAAEGETIGASIKRLKTQFFAPSYADLSTLVGGAAYKRVDEQPSHDLWIRTADRFLADGTTDATNGGYWEIDEREITPQMAGAIGVVGTDDVPAFQKAADASIALKRPLVNSETLYCYSTISMDSGFNFNNKGKIWRGFNAELAEGWALFRTANWRSGEAAAYKVENVRLNGLDIEDLDGTVEGIWVIAAWTDGFEMTNFRFRKLDETWSVLLEAENVVVGAGEIFNATGVIYCDGIHVVGGRDMTFFGLNIKSGDDCIAFHPHTAWPEYSRYDEIANATVTGCVLYSGLANSIRIGAQDASNADMHCRDILVTGNVMPSGVALNDQRATVNNLHDNIRIKNNICGKVLLNSSTLVNYGRVYIEDNTIEQAEGESDEVLIELNGGCEKAYVKRNTVNSKANTMFATVEVIASVLADVTDNEITCAASTSGAGQGIVVNAPRQIFERNRVDCGDHYAGVAMSAGSDYASCCDNEMTGTVNRPFRLLGGDYLRLDGNNLALDAVTTEYEIAAYTAGWGTIRSSGAPAGPANNLPNGFRYVRSDGGSGTTFYKREAGAWVAE